VDRKPRRPAVLPCEMGLPKGLFRRPASQRKKRMKDELETVELLASRSGSHHSALGLLKANCVPLVFRDWLQGQKQDLILPLARLNIHGKKQDLVNSLANRPNAGCRTSRQFPRG